ncbi:MAG: hydroxysqualene dehydroxylase HpnE [Betaproteobacteria bacterium]
MTVGADGRAAGVAVIGGGYAGMAAAVALAGSGIGVTVFEAGKVLGGRARRVEYRGETIDNGQHILSGAYSEMQKLMARVGVPVESVSRIPLTLAMPPDFSLRAPRWIAPLHLAWALLTAKGLALSDRLAAIGFMQSLKRSNFRVGATETVASLLAAHHQPDKLIRYLWQPLTVSALNTPMDTASAQVFANVLRDTLASDRAASDLILPRRDLSGLFPDAAADWVAARGGCVHRGQRIKSVVVDNGKFQLATEAGGSTFNAVIVAIGPHQFESFSLPADCAVLPAFSYEPIVTIYLKFEQQVRLPLPMFGQVGGMAQWFFDRRQLAADAVASSRPDGLIAAVISASGAHEDLSQDALAARVLDELGRHTGPLPALAWHKVIIEKFATFACTPSIHTKRPGCLTATPGIFLAGDYTAGDYPATIEGAIRSGISAADHVSRYLSTTPS